MAAQALLGRITLLAQRRPALARDLFRLAERVLGTGRLAQGWLVGRHAAVREVFARPRDFLMGYSNRKAIRHPPFLLGMDPDPDYEREHALLKAVLDDCFAGFPPIAARAAEVEAAALAPRDGRLDLGRYAERVLARSLGELFGVDARHAQSEHLDAEPGLETLALFIRTAGVAIASPHPAPFGLEQLADAVAPEFKGCLVRSIEARRGALEQGDPVETVIDRLLAAGLPPGDVARNVAGMLSASAGFPKAFAHAMHELLARRESMQELVALLREPPGGALDEARIHGYVREALRFRPVFPLLRRYCPHATTLGGAPGQAPCPVSAGRSLYFAPLLAMFDSSAVERPEEFIPGRPQESYILFGDGPRRCIGERVIMSLFAPMLAELFAHWPAAFAAAPGSFRHDGGGLEHYWIEVTGS